MTNGEHLHGSLYGVTVSGSLLKWQFDRMIKLFLVSPQIHKLYKSFCLYRLCKKFNIFGAKLTGSKSKSFYLNRKRWLQKSSSKHYNSYADVHCITEYKAPCSFMHCFQFNIKHLWDQKDTIIWSHPYVPTFLTEKTVA